MDSRGRGAAGPIGATIVDRADAGGAGERTLADVVLDRLAGGGARLTRPRRMVVEVLAHTDRPLSVPEIVAACAVPQSTIYRVLLDLEGRRLVDRIPGADELGRYELSAELAGRHHHLMCSECGLVVDIELSADLEARVAESARQADPTVEMVIERLDLIGRCVSCP